LNYKYLVIEGNIGAGKTTLATMLARDTGSRTVLEKFSDNPFLALFYENPHRYAFQLELSFLAERYQQVKAELGHHDLFGVPVISDYLLAKSIIFSNHNLKAEELVLFKKMFHMINLQVPRPDLYVYLHAPAERLLENIYARGRPYERNITKEYLKEVQDGYFGFFKTQSELKILVIDITCVNFVENDSEYQKIKEVILTGEFRPGMNMLIL